MNFQEIEYYGPQNGKTAQEWAEEIYGTKLTPLRKKSVHTLDGPLTSDNVQAWLKNLYMTQGLALGRASLAELADQVLTTDGLHIPYDRVQWHVRRGPSPNEIIFE